MKEPNKRAKWGVALAVSLLLPASAAIADGSALVYPPQSAAFGEPFRQWTADWWQFMLSIPTAVNPLADETGQNCMVGQRGAVWFLAGNFGGTAAPTTRACSIPEDKALFFPVLNVVDVNTTTQTANELRTETAPCVDAVTRLTVEVDGQPVSVDKNRVRSAVFEIAVPADNLFGIDAGIYSPAIDDGYYVMLKPLGVGEHEIHIVGASAGCPLLGGNAFSTEVTYNVTIVPVSLH
jgi:hypothetical protein